MMTRHILSTVTRLVVATAVAATGLGCGSDLLRTGRAPVFLQITGFDITNGASDETGGHLRSDVVTVVDDVPSLFNDTAVANISAIAKNPVVLPTDVNDVTITRYRIVFRRADGRNTPGVDVPFGWDGGVSIRIPAGGSAGVPFEIVRHSSKLEPPLAQLANGGGQVFIYTVAEITFFGRDQNGNEVTVTGMADVAFGDFADPQ
jgi:hypothetical protein